MYVHPFLSDYVRIHNLEFEDGHPKELKYDDFILEKLELTVLKYVKYFDNS